MHKFNSKNQKTSNLTQEPFLSSVLHTECAIDLDYYYFQVIFDHF